MHPVVFLGLGSNLGDREAAIADALARLATRGVAIRERSSSWLTEPVGGPPQGWFVNAAAGVETALSPRRSSPCASRWSARWAACGR